MEALVLPEILEQVLEFLQIEELLLQCRFVSHTWNVVCLSILKRRNSKKSGRTIYNYLDAGDDELGRFVQDMNNIDVLPLQNFSIHVPSTPLIDVKSFTERFGTEVRKLVVLAIPSQKHSDTLLTLLQGSPWIVELGLRFICNQPICKESRQNIASSFHFPTLRVININWFDGHIHNELLKQVVVCSPNLSHIILSIHDWYEINIGDPLGVILANALGPVDITVTSAVERKCYLPDYFLFRVPSLLVKYQHKIKGIHFNIGMSFNANYDDTDIDPRGVNNILAMSEIGQRLTGLKIMRNFRQPSRDILEEFIKLEPIELSEHLPKLSYLFLFCHYKFAKFSQKQFPALKHVILFKYSGLHGNLFQGCSIPTVTMLELYYEPYHENRISWFRDSIQWRKRTVIHQDWHLIFPNVKQLTINTLPPTFPYIFQYFGGITHLHLFLGLLKTDDNIAYFWHTLVPEYKKFLTGFDTADNVYSEYSASAMLPDDPKWTDVFSGQANEFSLRSLKELRYLETRILDDTCAFLTLNHMPSFATLVYPEKRVTCEIKESYSRRWKTTHVTHPSTDYRNPGMTGPEYEEDINGIYVDR